MTLCGLKLCREGRSGEAENPVGGSKTRYGVSKTRDGEPGKIQTLKPIS